ncbi:Transposase (plasmid) [Shigella dysenteriae WRSd3]|uniref:Transposase n=1 Tax=Shigella dysenteriae WRSd3 TaxID=1401327 RepID=A0A090N916_SHIDY|nr:Transposase [Shigella dysenteriae WRSd3]
MSKLILPSNTVSYRAHGLPVSENLLEQDFYASGPNQKWAGDITYLRTDEGLAVSGCGH